MNAIQRKYGPFAEECPAHWGMTHVLTCDAGSRSEMVKKSTDAEWLEAVIKHPNTQKTVIKAAEVRLRFVNKAIKSLLANYHSKNGRPA